MVNPRLTAIWRWNEFTNFFIVPPPEMEQSRAFAFEKRSLRNLLEDPIEFNGLYLTFPFRFLMVQTRGSGTGTARS